MSVETKLRTENRELRKTCRELARALKDVLEDLPEVGWVEYKWKMCERVLKEVRK